MKRTFAVAVVLALSATPAFATGQPSDTPDQNANPGTTHQPSTTPDEHSQSNPGTSHKLAAPGRYCKAESKKHVAGQKRTPFAECVVAQAKLRKGHTDSPREACKNESKKRVAGQHGTPFSLCVAAGAKLLKDQKAQSS
jgi:hypothetical protein